MLHYVINKTILIQIYKHLSGMRKSSIVKLIRKGLEAPIRKNAEPNDKAALQTGYKLHRIYLFTDLL